MVARPALIRQRDVTRILKGAKAEGIEMSIVVTADEVRFLPLTHTNVGAEASALEAWKAKRELRRTTEQRLKGPQEE